MTTLALDISQFRLQFPKYSNVTTYPNVTIQMYFDMATDYISAEDYGYLSGNSRLLALYQLTAHLLFLADAIAANGGNGLVVSAGEGAVNVSLAQPPFKKALQFWLYQSPYGQQLLALLGVKSAFGFYVAGSGVTGNIRKYNGRFS